MRRKSRRPRSNVQKQNKLRKRLMAISILLDNYIYKHRPISTADASSYLEEVMSFKPYCRNNGRELQVIEKLADFMKIIIKQENSTNNPTVFGLDTDVQKNCPNASYLDTERDVRINSISSPVYSLSEDDKLHISQEIDANNYNNDVYSEHNFSTNESCVAASDIFCEIKESVIHNNLSITDEMEIDNFIEKSDRNVHNISINRKEDGIDDDTECSQSILHNDHIMLCSQSVVQNVIIPDAVNENNATNKNSQLNNETEEMNINNIEQNIYSNKGENSMEASFKHTMVTSIQAKTRDNNTELKDNSQTQISTDTIKKGNMLKRKNRKLKNNLETCPLKEVVNTKAKPRKRSQKIKPKHKEFPPTTEVLTQINSSTGASHETCYKLKRHVEDELSWIDKIKFVRQVNKDEFTLDVGRVNYNYFKL